MSETSPCLQPLDLQGHIVRNRITMLSTRNNFGTNTAISEPQIQYYRERAAGGVGMIVTEGLAVHPSSIPNTTVPLAYSSELIEGFGKLAQAVKGAGATLVGQLWHIGRQRVQGPAGIPWGASALPDPMSGVVPHVMTEDEILSVVEGYARAARNLWRAGFDGVEVHGAHGYLLSEFFSPLSNDRTDRWGGSMENRSRLATEVVDAVRAATDDSFIVGLKVTVDELQPGGLDVSAMLDVIAHIEATSPPSYWGVSEGRASTDLHRVVPPMDAPVAPILHHARTVRQMLREQGRSTPVLGLGKIPDLDRADEAVAAGDADLIGMGRPLIADAELVAKTVSGKRARPCIYCNYCWNRTFTQRSLACVFGDSIGAGSEPVDGHVDHVTEHATGQVASQVAALPPIHVIGAGAAGLEFARVAATRGYSVTVFEAREQAGGWLREESRLPGRELLESAADWLEHSALEQGVKIFTGQQIGADDVAQWGEAIVVQATGAFSSPPALGSVDVTTIESFVAAPEAQRSVQGIAVVLDLVEDEPAYSAALWLARQGAAVHLVTRQGEAAGRVPYVTRVGIHEQLDRANVVQHTLTEPVRAVGLNLMCRHVVSRREHLVGPVDRVVAVGPFRSTESLLRADPGAGLIIGDALAPRPLAEVLSEARAMAGQIEKVTQHGTASMAALALDPRARTWFAPGIGEDEKEQ